MVSPYALLFNRNAPSLLRMYRRKKAREFFVERVRQAYEKVFDEENDVYFYYNKLSGTSEWNAPKVLLGRPLDPKV